MFQNPFSQVLIFHDNLKISQDRETEACGQNNLTRSKPVLGICEYIFLDKENNKNLTFLFQIKP